jgi:branched-chain amino acid transport system substrate-binding protein
MMHHRVLSHARSVALAGLLAVAVASAADAQKKYDPGATDTEIKIGNIMPYSGPASAYATIGKTEDAYFKKINAEGGINGRKINFISYDDGYNPAKTVEQARKLVEADEVLLIFNFARHPRQHRDSKIHEHQEGPADFRIKRRRQMERSEEFSMDDRLAAELPGRGADLCRLHPEEFSRQDHRRHVSER